MIGSTITADDRRDSCKSLIVMNLFVFLLFILYFARASSGGCSKWPPQGGRENQPPQGSFIRTSSKNVRLVLTLNFFFHVRRTAPGGAGRSPGREWSRWVTGRTRRAVHRRGFCACGQGQLSTGERRKGCIGSGFNRFFLLFSERVARSLLWCPRCFNPHPAQPDDTTPLPAAAGERRLRRNVRSRNQVTGKRPPCPRRGTAPHVWPLPLQSRAVLRLSPATCSARRERLPLPQALSRLAPSHRQESKTPSRKNLRVRTKS